MNIKKSIKIAKQQFIQLLTRVPTSTSTTFPPLFSATNRPTIHGWWWCWWYVAARHLVSLSESTHGVHCTVNDDGWMDGWRRYNNQLAAGASHLPTNNSSRYSQQSHRAWWVNAARSRRHHRLDETKSKVNLFPESPFSTNPTSHIRRLQLLVNRHRHETQSRYQPTYLLLNILFRLALQRDNNKQIHICIVLCNICSCAFDNSEIRPANNRGCHPQFPFLNT